MALPSDNCAIRFSAPSFRINGYGFMDLGGLTNLEWMKDQIGISGMVLKWIKQNGGNIPDAGSKIYVLPTSDICVNNNLTNAASFITDLNIQGGTFDFGATSTSISGNITNDGTITGGSGTITMEGS